MCVRVCAYYFERNLLEWRWRPNLRVTDVLIDHTSEHVLPSKTYTKATAGMFPEEGPSDAQVGLKKNYKSKQREKSREKERVYCFGECLVR